MPSPKWKPRSVWKAPPSGFGWSGPDLPLLRALLLRTRDDGTGWGRASALRRPVHVYARLGLGAQGAQSFERLILPFSANGDRVDRAILLLAAEQDGRSLLEW